MYNILALLCHLVLAATLINGSTQHERKPYIIYLGELPVRSSVSLQDEHHSLLFGTLGDEEIARNSIIHSYGKSFNGFAANLLPEEAEILSENENVVSVFPNTRRKLHTTRSWEFLGLTEGAIRTPVESDVIIGVLDTGIYVQSPSFHDKGLGPPPAKWKGTCMVAHNFTGCNKKVIGARFYDLNKAVDPTRDDRSPEDTDGHGTHTASTAAGIAVQGASLFGLAAGTARGGVPAARVAVYKVCWYMGCSDMDLLAAFDDAILDGVDIISVSIGGASRTFLTDPIAIGTFHATKRGILTSCSAGNDGPYQGTVQNVAPWIVTVGATSSDRKFITPLKLGNGDTTLGISVNTFSLGRKMYPLISGTLAGNATSNSYGNVSACDAETLSPQKVAGKIVYCLGSSGQDTYIQSIGGVGTVLALDEPSDIAFTSLMPSTSVFPKQGLNIDRYINSTKNPQAVIDKTNTVTTLAPFVASFSSRGPQSINYNILKPDISAPGLDILAAYSQLVSITGDETDERISPFNIISGTSMACPHVSAAAAYVKSFHPEWSPAAVKSALMTTAMPMKVKDKDAELGSGSGQIDPVRAVHPGLIYDINMSGYISFLCKEGYNGTTIGKLLGGNAKFDCAKFRPARGADGLNYPTMHVQINSTDTRISVIFYRVVTHVGCENSVYQAKVMAPKGLSVKVMPNVLRFQKLHEKKSFRVVVKGGQMPKGTQVLSALLEWNDSVHSVRSPILVYKIEPYSS